MNIYFLKIGPKIQNQSSYFKKNSHKSRKIPTEG